MSPKKAASPASLPGKMGCRAWMAETRMETAINTSTGRLGAATNLHTARDRLIECPMVKAVTILRIRRRLLRVPA